MTQSFRVAISGSSFSPNDFGSKFWLRDFCVKFPRCSPTKVRRQQRLPILGTLGGHGGRLGMPCEPPEGALGLLWGALGGTWGTLGGSWDAHKRHMGVILAAPGVLWNHVWGSIAEMLVLRSKSGGYRHEMSVLRSKSDGFGVRRLDKNASRGASQPVSWI